MRLYRPHRGLSGSGVRSGAGCLNVPLRICEPEDERSKSRCRVGVDVNPQTVSSTSGLGAKGLPGDHASIPLNRHECAPPSSYCPAGSSSGRCGAPRSLNVFRAECCWDPVFVVAPARLVGLQNQAAARAMGSKRARLAAWKHIDGPEASKRNVVRAQRGRGVQETTIRYLMSNNTYRAPREKVGRETGRSLLFSIRIVERRPTGDGVAASAWKQRPQSQSITGFWLATCLQRVRTHGECIVKLSR